METGEKYALQVNNRHGRYAAGFFSTFMVAGVVGHYDSLSFEARKLQFFLQMLEFFPRALEFFQKP